jgi:hypothetical protein
MPTREFEDGKIEDARENYAKAFEAADKLYALKPTAKNLRNLSIVAADLYDALEKLNRHSEAKALEV